MHDVQRDIDDFRHGDGAAGRFAFALRRTGEHMAQRRGEAFGEHLRLQIRNELAVLGVHLGQGPQLPATQEAGNEVLVGQHQAALVGQEELETGNAVVAHQDCHLLGETRPPPRHGHVKAIVDHRLGRPVAPGVQRFQGRLAAARSDEIQDGRGAAGCCGGRAGVEIVGHDGAHHRQLQMGVRIDSAGHHEAATGVNDLAAGLNVQVGADGGDQAVAGQQVSAPASVGRDQRAAPDHGLVHGVVTAASSKPVLMKLLAFGSATAMRISSIMRSRRRSTAASAWPSTEPSGSSR